MTSRPPLDSSFVTLFRVSTKQQAERYGLDWQRSVLPAYGETHLGACAGIYDEGATSTGKAITARADLQDLLSDLEQLRPDYLLLADQDRLSRGDDFWLTKLELRKHGVRLAYYRENAPPEILDLDDEQDDFMSDIHGAVAKLEKRKITKRMRRGKQQAARRGKFVQPVPYGYWKPAPGELAIDPEAREIVVIIFKRIAAGSSIRKTVQWLNGMGIPSPRGKIGGWTISSLSKLLKNTSYIGKGRILGVDIEFPRLIDDKLFFRVQEAVRENQRRSRRNNTRFDYLVRSLSVCGRCGRAVCGTTKHAKPYYKCSGRNHDMSKGLSKEERCSQRDVPAELVDNAVWAALQPLLLNPELIAAHAKSPATVVEAEATFLRRKLTRYDERRRNVLTQHEHGHIDDTELDAAMTAINAERDADAAKLSELEPTTREQVDLSRLEEAEALCRALAPRLEKLSFADKRALVEKLVRRVVFDGRNITVETIVSLFQQAPRDLAADAV